MIDKETVIAGTSIIIVWWAKERMKKLRAQLSDTMSVNPFMLPFLFEYHNLSDFEQLQDLTIASHLVTGHNTGFGKLIDEKILPGVFKTIKLDRTFRRTTPPYNEPCFDEIDHIIVRSQDKTELLSLKAGKWTIQLTMAVQLNTVFNEILERFGASFSDIVVGVFYGRREQLTDKYDILRGINRGVNHDVIDLTDRVLVKSGKDFWAWLNDGEEQTQEWVLEGIIKGLESIGMREERNSLLKSFKEKIVQQYDAFIEEDGSIRWLDILRDING